MDLNDMMKNMGGLGDLGRMMTRMKDAQEAIRRISVEGSAGGGMVVVEMNGAGDMLDVRIEREVIDPDDAEMLQDLIVAAAADAKRKAADAAQEEMGKAAGGLDLSGLDLDLPGIG